MQLFSHISAEEKSQFASNLSIMLKSGIPFDEALSVLEAQSTSAHMKRTISEVAGDIANGVLLSVAFAKREKEFGAVFVNLIKAAEESGTLQESLRFLADWFERSADLRREVGSATLYPKLVLSASLLLGGALAIFILPRLVPLFSELDVELPLITKVLLAFSVFIQSYWLWCILGFVTVIVTLRLLYRIPLYKHMVHAIEISLPVLGPILREYQLALISQLFATLLRSGVPLMRAVEIVEDAAPNMLYQDTVAAMREQVSVGMTLSTTMQKYRSLYPQLYVSLILVGERSGTLSDSFMYLADHYTKEVKAKARRLPTIIEPILLIFIAMIVGLVALAIILPIYKLTGGIG